tara:strand:- start:42 stop:287 length:246 start_codon:yes stop_codon:yes gene_type:complete
MSVSARFKSQCHTLYDRLHGQRKISQLFDAISDNQVEELMTIYKIDVFHRWNNIENYLKQQKLNNEWATSFYVNALQHFMG